VPSIDAAGLALIDISGAPRISQRFGALAFGTNPGFAITYLSKGLVLFGTLGYLGDSSRPSSLDSVIRSRYLDGTVAELLRSQSQPFTLRRRALRCAVRVCFVTDAERSGGSVLRFPIDDAGSLGTAREIRAETQVGSRRATWARFESQRGDWRCGGRASGAVASPSERCARRGLERRRFRAHSTISFGHFGIAQIAFASSSCSRLFVPRGASPGPA